MGRWGTVCVIPARAGSKRVPGKNVRPLAGQALVVWSVRAALGTPEIDRTIVSTDDPRVRDAVCDFDLTVVERPPALATSRASTDDVLRHVDEYLGGAKDGPELLVLLQATSPFREAGRVSEGVHRMRQHPDAARLVEVTSQSLFSGAVADGGWHPSFSEDTRSQDLPPIWHPTGGLYIYRCALWFDRRPDGTERNLALETSLERCVNIDHEADFAWAEHVYHRFSQDYAYLDPSSHCPARH